MQGLCILEANQVTVSELLLAAEIEFVFWLDVCAQRLQCFKNKHRIRLGAKINRLEMYCV